MDNKPKSPGQRAYEKTGFLTPWDRIGNIMRARWHIKALKAEAQAVTRAVQRWEEGKTE